jgi:hypothetical protein
LFDPFDWGVWGAGGVGVVVVCHETKVVDVDGGAEEGLDFRMGAIGGDLGGGVACDMWWDDDDDTFVSAEEMQ